MNLQSTNLNKSVNFVYHLVFPIKLPTLSFIETQQKEEQIS